ncbi:nucleotidyl transferase AbiEii/AbiGii toxin family protein [Aquiflexum lacus]|uniref:nucleotidyl transferase AbiEii/AbiGii toxin family protein n=1 Tax=Aquiflexum lacus TaxID=2483805 RepID=UPI0018957401|nr:nucleotidyl transferase AbiEii/AbiGii toxin family protein [Aquiflexum lacus]
MKSLYWNTVSADLGECLLLLMNHPLFDDFRLVGGTALSLHLGHRLSVDIDLFSSGMHGSLNFDLIDSFLRSQYKYVSAPLGVPIGFGRSYLLGETSDKTIKLDLYYTEPYLDQVEINEYVRMASIKEIAAMKIDVVQRRGRKKDFWDIHELLDKFTVSQLLDLHLQKYPYNHEKELILKNMIDFDKSDDEPDPTCLKGKYWDLIKLDIIEAVKEI